MTAAAGFLVECHAICHVPRCLGLPGRRTWPTALQLRGIMGQGCSLGWAPLAGQGRLSCKAVALAAELPPDAHGCLNRGLSRALTADHAGGRVAHFNWLLQR